MSEVRADKHHPSSIIHHPSYTHLTSRSTSDLGHQTSYDTNRPPDLFCAQYAGGDYPTEDDEERVSRGDADS